MRPEEARAALATVGLESRDVVELLGGWAFHTFDLDGRWIVRFPRNATSALAAEHELRLLPDLAKHVSFSIPEPSHDGIWNGQPFFAYPKIRGRGMTASDGSPGLLRAVGAALGELHSFPIERTAELLDTGPPAEAAITSLGTLWPDIEEHALPQLPPELAARVASEFQRYLADPPEAPATFIHNDLGLEHVLIEDGDFAGIIDFECADVGDPAIDFVPLAATFGADALQALLSGRDLGARLAERLWFYRWVGSLHAIIYGVTESNPRERDAGIEQLRLRIAHRPVT